MKKRIFETLTKFVGMALIIVGVLFIPAIKAEAAQATKLNASISLSNGNGAGNITDGSYNSASSFNAGDSVTISADQNIGGIYIAWNRIPSPWTLTVGDSNIQCGENGFLHEYVEIPSGANTVTLNFESDCSICYIECYGEGEIPADVEVWQASPERVDFLVVSSHSDDEILFLGAVLPTYAKEKECSVQVCYLTEFWSTTPIREHEKLDGLWASGITIYPVCGDFYDVYCSDLDNARLQYNQDDMVAYLTKTVRRFKPQVIVTQDENGEYGHGFHMLVCDSVKKAVENANDATFDADSASVYGTWDTPKTYLHLYSENKIKLDCRQPLESMGGQTALEIATNAYLKHVSQQWCWFYVSDEYEYSIADFGLYRTTVGTDENNDMMEHLKTYAVQEQEAYEAEQAELAAKQAEEERIKAEQLAAEQAAEEEEAAKIEEEQNKGNVVVIVLVVVLALVVLLAVIVIARASIARKRRRNRRTRR